MITRPIGTGVSDTELEQLVPVYQQQAYQRRLRAEIHWLVASCTLDGYAYHEVDWATRHVDYHPLNSRSSTKVDIPEMVNRFRRELGRKMSIIREPTTKPLATGIADIYRLNRFARGACAHLWKSMKFQEKAPYLIGEMLLSGLAGTLPYWLTFPDGPREDGEDGDVAMRWIPAWQLYPWPASAIDDDSVEGLIWARPVREEWVKQNFPDAVNERTVRAITPFEAVGTPTSSSDRGFEGFIVRQVFIRPSRRFPQGDQFWMVGDKIYRREGQLNFRIGKRREIPISVCRWLPKPTSWWGESFGYQVTRLNKEINRMMGLLVKRAIMKAHPGYMMVPMGSCAVDDFKQQIGGVIQYRPSLINPEATRPHWLVPQPGTADSDVVLNRFNNYLQDVTSQHEATEGTAAGRGDSATFVQALVRQDMIPAETTIQQVSTCIARTMSLALEIGRARWKAPKAAAITGPAGQPRAQVVINPREIPDLDQIEVVTHLDLPMDKPTLLNFLGQLATPPARDMEAHLTRQEYRRALQGMGVSIPGVDLIDPNEESAWRENLILYGDGINPGQVADPDPQLEDGGVHLSVHKAFAATMEVQTASDAVRLAIGQHIQLTALNLGGPAVPSRFDAEMIAQDSEDLTEEIELAQGSRLPQMNAQDAAMAQLAMAMGGRAGVM